MYLSYNSNTNIFAYACYAILKTLKHLSNSILFLSMYVWYITIYGLPSMYKLSFNISGNGKGIFWCCFHQGGCRWKWGMYLIWVAAAL